MKYNIKKGGRAQCSTPQLPKCHGACGPYPPGPTGPQVTVSLQLFGQGGEASHRFCWESRLFLTWSVGITRDVRHNDEEKFGGIIFGNSPRSGCAHFQNSSSFIFSKCSSYSKVKLYSRFKYFKFIRKTTISCCQQIGDRHQMPYTNTGDKMVMRRVSVCH